MIDAGWSGRLLVGALTVAAMACDGGDTGDSQGGADANGPAAWGARCDARPGDDGETSAFLDFEVTGQGLESYEGATVRLLTYRLDDPQRIYGVAETTIHDGAFGAMWPDGYERFAYQPVVIHIDANGSGACEADVEPARRFISTAWNPVGDEPLVEDVTIFPLDEAATTALCDDIDRCGP